MDGKLSRDACCYIDTGSQTGHAHVGRVLQDVYAAHTTQDSRHRCREVLHFCRRLLQIKKLLNLILRINGTSQVGRLYLLEERSWFNST